MKALSSSYSKFSATNQKEKLRVFRCSTEIGFLVRQKRVRDFSFQLKRVPSISAVSSTAQTDDDSEEVQIISSDKAKTVRVRIKLLKECTFGEQFLVVGDDPILGLWDPSEGVPLDWSEGHVWTAEVDIPMGKVIKYKFIHRGNNGAILWQPGSDRLLQTWETEKIISVSEDWDNPDLQNIVEEDFVDVLNEASLMDSNLGQTLVKEGDINAVDKLCEELEGQDLSSSDEERSDLWSLKDERRLVLDEGVPVLVPGLVPASTYQSEAEEEVENTITQSDREIKDSAESEQQNGEEPSTELNGVHVPTASLCCTETGEMIVDEKQQYGEEEQMESNVLGSDMQWGRRTLQKFLANLGFI